MESYIRVTPEKIPIPDVSDIVEEMYKFSGKEKFWSLTKTGFKTNHILSLLFLCMLCDHGKLLNHIKSQFPGFKNHYWNISHLAVFFMKTNGGSTETYELIQCP